MENEKNIPRWGGLAGILAAIVFIITMVLYPFVDPLTPEGLMAFPDARAALALSISLSMTSAFLSIVFVLVLYRALRKSDSELPPIGSVVGVIGYIVTALGDAATIVAFAPLSDLYHAPGATLEAQATVALLWQTTMGITSTFFFLGGLFMMIGFIALGVAMLGATAFGKRFGWAGVGLGVVGVVGVVASLFVSGSIGVQLMGTAALANLIFLPLFGSKLYRLSNR